MAAARVMEMKARDIAVKVVSQCGTMRLSVANAHTVLEEMIRRHDLIARSKSDDGYECAQVVQHAGNTVVLSSLLASVLDREERVSMRFVGPVMAVTAESMALGECRAYVAPTPHDSTSVGTLRVDRVLYHHARPVTSVTHHPLDGDDALQHSLTRHAMNFFAKSDGTPSAVLLRSAVAQPPSTEEEPHPFQVQYNGGFVLQPIVDTSGHAASTVDGLQNALLQSLDTSECALWDATILKRALESRTNVQDLLSLATGDFEGAFGVAERCRAPTTSIATCAHDLEPLVKRLWGHAHAKPAVALDVLSSERTPLDFFCRCSKQDLLGALRSCSREQLQGACGQPVSCHFCRKDISPTSEEWDALLNNKA